MREIININENWEYKKIKEVSFDSFEGFEKVDLPHTYNALDGQDGGNDYYRGKVMYIKKISASQRFEYKKVYLEFNGVNSSADIYINKKAVFHHDGGYSTFRVDATDYLSEDENLIAVVCDNSANDHVYPQQADFTFYGGIYRDVSLIIVDELHFDLDYYGGKGIKVTPEIKDKNAKVNVVTYLNRNELKAKVRLSIVDADNKEIAVKEDIIIDNKASFDFEIENVHLWNGRKDPYLYKAKAELYKNGKLTDNIETDFGCRTFKIDPDEGFILNGKSYPLRGVSRHQDRPGIGNALLKKHHEEDIALIMEMGATTIRLAHYQHDQYFYDLCDKNGLVVWAEIPYISIHMDNGHDNTISQMKELIIQNYNHPCIVVWGLSNEITMKGDSTPSLINNHKELNDLCHQMDKTRLTTMAIISMCKEDDPYIQIPDVVSWNHYFGWYGGNTNMNGPFMDEFHKKYPRLPVGMSEYGCEALNWHTNKPHQGDYTEEYQAHYHEELIKQLFTRKYIWATHAWNMFDFGADGRNEGGENGQNHKGLVTFDRKYKKDAFYAYKAWLSDDPFVHICSKRYVDRTEDETNVVVYSNQPEVKLYVNDVLTDSKKCENHFFHFKVRNIGESKIKAVAGNYSDESFIRKTDTPNEAYIFKQEGTVLNWFDIDEKEGYLSLNDSSYDLINSGLKGKIMFLSVYLKINRMKKKSGVTNEAAGMKTTKNTQKMALGFPMLRIANSGKQLGISFTKEQLLNFNKKLNKIKKKAKKDDHQ